MASFVLLGTEPRGEKAIGQVWIYICSGNRMLFWDICFHHCFFFFNHQSLLGHFLQSYQLLFWSLHLLRSSMYFWILVLLPSMCVLPSIMFPQAIMRIAISLRCFVSQNSFTSLIINKDLIAIFCNACIFFIRFCVWFAGASLFHLCAPPLCFRVRYCKAIDRKIGILCGPPA